MKAVDYLNLDKLKVVYFDIDGVLSIPRYPLGKDNQIIPFASFDSWKNYFYKENGSYDLCKSPESIYNWMSLLKSKGKIIRTLSVSTTFEQEAKLRFIDENYGDLIDSNVLVLSPEEKVEELKRAQIEFDCDRFEVALVEDNHYTLFDVFEEGFLGIHVSWFFDFV